MDPLRDKVLKRKEELLKELNEIELFLKLHRKFSEEHTPNDRTRPRDANHLTDMLNREPAVVLLGPANTPSQRSALNPMKFALLAEAAIRKVGRPMSRAEVVEAIESRGAVIPSSDKARYIGTIMWRRKDKFVHLESSGYLLREMMSPSALREYDERHRNDGDEDPDIG